MPKVNPAIMIWARQTAGLTQEEAARQLGFQDSTRSTAVEKLARIEQGRKDPSRPQLVKMAGQYRRPLLTFYLSKPPRVGKRGVDFRTLAQTDRSSDQARLDALIREIRARQSMVRVMLEDEDEAEARAFVGSHRMEDGRAAVLESLRALLRLHVEDYRAQSNESLAFGLLRGNAEDAGIFVLLKGDLGNYRTALDSAVFRGFSIADEVAPFVVINDQDARPAWSFTRTKLLQGASPSTGQSHTRADGTHGGGGCSVDFQGGADPGGQAEAGTITAGRRPCTIGNPYRPACRHERHWRDPFLRERLRPGRHRQAVGVDDGE